MKNVSGEENKSVFSRVVDEGYNKGNLTALDQLFAPNFSDHQNGIQPPTLEGVKGFIRNARTAFPDLTLTIEEIVSVRDKTWARITAQGTHHGVFMGLPPSGKTFTTSRFDVCRFEGGKIIEH